MGKQKNIKAAQEKEKNADTKTKWKKIAKEASKAQDAKTVTLSLKTSKKRPDNVENLFLIKGRSQKRVYDRNVNGSALFPNEMAVAIVQHC